MRILCIAAVCLGIAVGGYAVSKALMGRRERCPLPVAVTEYRGDMLIRLYNQQGYWEELGRIKLKKDEGIEALRYNSIEKRYILGVPIDNQGNLYVHITDGRKTRRIPLTSRALGEYDDFRWACSERYIYVMALRYDELTGHKNLMLSCFTISGDLRYERLLDIPNDHAVDMDWGESVSKDGLVAITLSTESTSSTQLMIFDAHGKLLKNLGSGMGPVFDPSGKKIAYTDVECVEISETESENKGTGKFVIYELKTGMKHYPGVECPPGHGRIALGSVGSILDYQWSMDGKWLLCEYDLVFRGDRALYAVNVNGRPRKWYKYPFVVDSYMWTVADAIIDQ